VLADVEVVVQVRVDVSQVPPVVEVREAGDLSRFSVAVVAPSHAWVRPEVLAELSGREGDEAWQEELAGMVRFADSQGWVDDAGRVRAHVEVERGDA
jgi:hypothetical protein